MPVAAGWCAAMLACALELTAGPTMAKVELAEAFPNLPDFTNPVDVQHDGAGRFYVVEQQGLILSFEREAAVSRVDTLIDLRAEARLIWVEDGLLGLALHPDYAENGFFYVYYLAGTPTRSVLARYTRSTTDPLRADPASRRELLVVEQPSVSHNGGGLAFGPDGNLYLSLGDGRCCGDPNEQGPDPTTLLGSLLRLDVDHPSGGRAYGIPPDNPFAGNTDGLREEIYAYGLRNPWQFSFDPATGDLWLGDVGEGTFEEINRIEAGGHYGWSVREGTRCRNPVEHCETAGLAEPVWVYYHGPHGAVVGGYVYRGSRLPEMVGRYLYGDWVSGQIWALTYDAATGAVTNEDLMDAGFRLSTFAVDPDGELYVADYDGGRLYALQRFTDTGTAAEGASPSPQSRFELAGPNPFRTTTAFAFTVERAAPVRLAVYDVLGRVVALLIDGPASPGTPHRAVFNADGLPAGVYFARMEQAGRVQVRTVVRMP